MNEENFREWLEQKYSRKVVSDNISRLKKVIREITDVDSEYDKDHCGYLLSLFDNLGDNDEMKSRNSSLPVGRNSIRSYKYALKLYVRFREEAVEY
ncbi:MAG: hypothetical protein NC320_13750 [Clostridium sp.]|nr:hypothetical protein [Clostridium sp.]